MSVKQFVEVSVYSLCSVLKVAYALLSQASIHDHKIVVFSKSWCPYSRRAKKLLAEEYSGEDIHIIEYVLAPFLRTMLTVQQNR